MAGELAKKKADATAGWFHGCSSEEPKTRKMTATVSHTPATSDRAMRQRANVCWPSVSVPIVNGASQLLTEPTPDATPNSVPAKFGARSRWFTRWPLADAPEKQQIGLVFLMSVESSPT